MAARLLAPQLIVFYCFVASALVVHLRGRWRHNFARELTDYSTLMAPYNLLMYLFSAVPNRPMLSARDFPELSKLRDNWQMIREEALVLFDEGHIKASEKYREFGFHSLFRRGWKVFYLKWHADPLPSAERLCPRTVALLQCIPNINGALFATLAPGARLPTHRDPYAGSLRYHLGLVTPTHPGKCQICVDGHEYSWHDGEDLMFDETFLHYAENTTDQTRVILLCDVERPLRTRFMTAVNRWVSRTIVKESVIGNEIGEHVGFINKMFLFIPVHELFNVRKRIKSWNKTAYFAMKCAVFGAILGGIIYSAL